MCPIPVSRPRRNSTASVTDGQLAGGDPPGHVAARDVLEHQRRALLAAEGDDLGAEQPDDVGTGHAAEPVHLPLEPVGRVGPVPDDLDGGAVPAPGLAERAATQERDGASQRGGDLGLRVMRFLH